MDINDIYTPLNEAKKEIERRRKDPVLDKKLKEFWGENAPKFLDGSPKAILSRSITTPNSELRYFLDICKDLDLESEFWEYTNGKLVCKNKEKKHLGKLLFYHGRGKNNGHKIEPVKVINFNKEEGKRMYEVKTLWGDKLTDFHHSLLLEVFPENHKQIKDISEWFDKTRFKTDYYYLYYLSLFIKNGILFENFIFDDKEESKFTLERFLPSFKKAVEVFGVKPLIFPVLPIENEKSELWLTYKKDIRNKITNKISFI